ncbi:MAG: putative DNA binding domain-containing protein [Rikenellaceae bacterium]|jgi:ATP-dependent DNA helicase RecG|nr:putative DNA binding domain-containing protein [Rikenellaceae bacterium]
MITHDHIKTLLTDIENERVERTTFTKDTDKFAIAVCAFANDLHGKGTQGYLLVGAEDDGALCGLKVADELLRNLAGLRSDGNILPQPALMAGKVSFPEGDLAVVEVQPSRNTPVRYKGVPWIRVSGPDAARRTKKSCASCVKRAKSNRRHSTRRPCLHSTILELFKTEYLPKFVKPCVLKNEKRTVKQQLASLQLFDLGHDCPTVAGVLLLGKNPKQLLFGAYIHCEECRSR